MKEKWFTLLAGGSNEVNLERVESISEINRFEVLEYVLKTLEYLDTRCERTEFDTYIRKALQWSEVAKCGSNSQRAQWEKSGINLSIHNIGSADIYDIYTEDDNDIREFVKYLIRIHGIIGQYLRGEVSDLYLNYLDEFLRFFNEKYDKNKAKDVLTNLTASVIAGVDEELWKLKKEETENIISEIVSGKISNLSSEERIKKIKSNFASFEFMESLPELGKYSFWYPEVALSSLNDRIFVEILKDAIKKCDGLDVYDINFKPVSEFLYYDYEGKKHVNVYKKRIIEHYYKMGSQHIFVDINIKDNVMFFGFKLSAVCEKLVDFCNEAELSGDISYEQAIVMLFDFFDFRHDKFDRLNNEDFYLGVMDDISTSRKGELINYVTGNTVVDVGSGSGVLLNLLEERFPSKTIIGTDVSTAVLEKLNSKKNSENHKWNIANHNFVEAPFDACDTIIFSSILHEIFSFSEYNGKLFNSDSVRESLKNAYNSLNKGGRIVIRDGIKTNSDSIVKLLIHTKEGKDFFLNYLKDFEGLPEINRDKIKYEDNEDEFVVTAPINYLREFMYTYTWGVESYFNEVKEQFGYYTIDEFKEVFNSLGAKIHIAEEYFEQEYYNHLHPLLSLTDMDGNEINFPNSNCIVVVEKI